MKTFPVQQAFPLRMSYLLLATIVLFGTMGSSYSFAQTAGDSPNTDNSELPAPAAESTYQIIRDVNGSGGNTMSGGTYRLHGTVSETVIGRVARPNQNNDLHKIGFWYWAQQVRAVACVRMPVVSAEAGTTFSVPVIIEQTDRLPLNGSLRFRARIRFNRTLLQPVGQTPGCSAVDGDDCLLDIDVPVTAASITSGVLTELRFLAKLGNAESTPLVIEDFSWSGFGEQPIQTITKPGEFILLGICREGGEIRLIHSTGPASRIRVWPNPAQTSASVEFISREEGTVRLSLVDALGREVAMLSEQSVEGVKLYRMDLDISTIPSGSYFLVFRTPTEVKTTRITIEQ
ncbi:MAG: T9SS type A sorting domain-containing protein [Ignavibacteriae bacterium]|nr:T9SS type A sorting domain-containing protein [Ignavibacteriota bacterium]MCB9217529.1 T9SS type A sorting domain-containing protein [Ignavibacteria bacterium]